MNTSFFIIVAACGLFVLFVAGIFWESAKRIRALEVSLKHLGLSEEDLAKIPATQVDAWRRDGVSTSTLASAYIDSRVLTRVN